MTLTEFLLARIAEDEARAPLVNNCPYNLEDVSDDDWAGVHWTTARVLAECEAKRGIVESARHAEERWENADQRVEVEVARAAMAEADEAVAHLAVVYADHADYRDEWRP